ncbi:MAG: ABC transporter ATP-binding protein [Verrucomicrobia bacterium]|nr:ABC transporter ATP-binding protein [Verrucomicrobiota bacterium]MCH8513582.1 ABC transporter ATP-binding protein [Kiritimatiellia bacterium]
MTDPILVENLEKTFGRTKALDGVSFRVSAGSFMGFFGPNGAGKTTTIKALMNLIPHNRGSAQVLGVSSNRLGRAEFRRIGYVSENQDMPLWMTLGQLIQYCRPMYPTWDDGLCESLRETFKLPLNQKLKGFSRGMRMKAALLTSLAYHPEVVVLDEPFSGLDPLSRDQFVEGLMELSGDKSFTLLLSTHDVGEIERLCDAVTFIDHGRVDVSESTDSLLSRFRRVVVQQKAELKCTKLFSTWKAFRQNGERVEFVETQFDEIEALKNRLSHELPGSILKAVEPMSLREVIVQMSQMERGGK